MENFRVSRSRKAYSRKNCHLKGDSNPILKICGLVENLKLNQWIA